MRTSLSGGPGERPGAPLARERGFLLIELVFGIVVLVVAVGSTMSLSAQHSRLRRLSEEIDLARIACRNNLEELRSIRFGDLPTLDGAGFDVLGADGLAAGLQPVPDDADGLPGRFTVTVDQSGGGEVLYMVVAEVTWTGVSGVQRISFRSLFGDR